MQLSASGKIDTQMIRHAENVIVPAIWIRLKKNVKVARQSSTWLLNKDLFLANENSSSCSLYVIGSPSVVCRLSSVCLSVCRL